MVYAFKHPSQIFDKGPAGMRILFRLISTLQVGQTRNFGEGPIRFSMSKIAELTIFLVSPFSLLSPVWLLILEPLFLGPAGRLVRSDQLGPYSNTPVVRAEIADREVGRLVHIEQPFHEHPSAPLHDRVAV